MKTAASAFTSRIAVVGAAATLISIGAPVRADLKVVSDVAVTSSDKPAVRQAVTTWFKGDMVRTETDRTISLYDAKEQTITTADKQRLIYRVTNLKNILSGNPGLMSRVQFNATASMEPKGDVKTIAGRLAHRYVGNASFSLSLDGLPAKSSPGTTMQIEQWSVESLSAPASTSQMANPLLRISGPLQSMRGMEPLVKALAQVKGMPVSSRISIVAKNADGSSKSPVVTTTDVISISEGSLSADLFKLPAGFHRVEPAPIPSAPGAAKIGAK